MSSQTKFSENHLTQSKTSKKTIFLILIIGISFGAFFTYFLFATFSLKFNTSLESTFIPNSILSGNSTTATTISNPYYIIPQQAENICTSQINNLISVLQEKLPSGTSISIINTIIFPAETNASTIQSWDRFWQIGNGNNYLNKDILKVVASENTGNNSGFLTAVGIVIKIQFQPAGAGEEIEPLLCNKEGILLNDSKTVENIE